jgi:hypothetical protein
MTVHPRRPDNRITRLVPAASAVGVLRRLGGRYRGGNQPFSDLGPEHRSIVVIDIAGFGRWRNRAQLNARAVLNAMVRAAFRAAGIPWRKLAVEDRGDGMIVLVPAAVSKVDLLDPVLPHLTEALREHNTATEPELRIRLRVSVHAGEIHRDACGWVGTDLNLACRLVNSGPVYQQLRRSAHADLVLVVSDMIHHGVVQHGYRRINPASYKPINVVVKEIHAQAWVHVPDEPSYIVDELFDPGDLPLRIADQSVLVGPDDGARQPVDRPGYRAWSRFA